MDFRKDFEDRNVGFQLAPMIDIMFLLLIFFMVVSLAVKWETKVDIQVPTADTGVQPERVPNELIVNVRTGYAQNPDGSYRLGPDGARIPQVEVYINDSLVNPERLAAMLASYQRLPGTPVIIRGDRATRFEHIMQVMDICRKLDIWNLSFAVIPADEGAGGAGDGQ